jgi:hypothetical protein
MTHFLRDILRQPEELQGVIDFLAVALVPSYCSAKKRGNGLSTPACRGTMRAGKRFTPGSYARSFCLTLAAQLYPLYVLTSVSSPKWKAEVQESL